jgi:hypothetical protein
MPITNTLPAKYAPHGQTIIDGFLNIPTGKHDFALSLLQQAAKPKGLSEKQEYWFAKLAEMAVGSPPAQPEGVQTCGELTAIMDIFATAGKHLKRPKVSLAIGDGRKVRLWPAPQDGKNAGHLYIKLDGEYCGKVTPSGTFLPFKLDDADIDQISDLLAAFADDPAGFATVHGQKTGNCCFCSTQIKTKESLAVGYGPDCADHFGLPWGDI